MKRTLRSMVWAVCGLGACSALSGCVMVGYSSRSGFFFWPGGLGLLVLLGILWLIFSRR
ncbi:hypothetical protein SAMN05443244_2629 [Terriglobus roseus]|uniref:Lipoprotein n=1 Tax=Terriglobus roseus TaxID=392734 RepID=A0A1H4PPR2_9BACT|nr:hypothetical protein SAMN05443244_2629 [Terriglobus roseus]